MMSTQEVGACGNRLQYLFEVLHAIRTLKGRRFHEIEVELSSLLGVLTVSSEYITFQEVMRFCDKCAGAIDSKVRECSENLYRRKRGSR